MFKNWGFLIGEIWFLILLAALLGLFVGWLIWGRMVARMRSDLDACNTRCAQLKTAMDAKAEPADKPALSLGSVASAPVSAPEPVAAPVKSTKPETLTEARGGMPDDLKLIKGIGPQMEALCNKLGFFHFDQIANWSASDLAWVDDNLDGFKGRASRDEWVAQARVLAAGGAQR